MDLSQLLEQLMTYRSDLDSAVRLLKEVSHLEQNRSQNLPQLKARLTKLSKVVERVSQSTEPVQVLSTWLEWYQQELVDTEQKAKERFAIELEGELKKRGISLSGQYPNLRAGLFTIEVDRDKNRAILWYGYRQERMDQCYLSAARVATRIEEILMELGSHLNEDEFLKKLHEAYLCVVDGRQGEPAPIIKVLGVLELLLKSTESSQELERGKKKRRYSRADFSYDLFRTRRSGQTIIFGNRLHLTVATRAYTNQRQKFLWVPDDESGRGTAYSHLQFKEGLL